MSYTKDPDAVLDYKMDWSLWLANGETITSSTWIVPAGITKQTDTHDTTSATIWLTSGTAGSDYQVTNRIVTTGGRTDDRTIEVLVSDR